MDIVTLGSCFPASESARVADGGCGWRVQSAARAGFKRFAFDDGIRPFPQRRDVDVDPVVPPINRERVVTEGFFLCGWQCLGKEFDMVCLKRLLVVQNE